MNQPLLNAQQCQQSMALTLQEDLWSIQRETGNLMYWDNWEVSMKAEIILNYMLPTQGDWKGLGIFAIVVLFAIIGQMWASKRILWMQSDAYKLSLAYLGVFLITAVVLANGGFI